MKRLLDKYITKMVRQGLAGEDSIFFLGLDAELESNRPSEAGSTELARVFEMMNINSLLYAEPAEPYRSIICSLTEQGEEKLTPSDCETRTFLHDIPVIEELKASEIFKALSRRKAAIIRGKGIVAHGTVSPEQAFVSFSSACFSAFVKFFTDIMFSLEDCRKKNLPADERTRRSFHDIVSKLPPDGISENPVAPRVPEQEDDVYASIVKTGTALVDNRLVDSYFGNISYVHGNKIYISQTGSSLDELETCIDAVPLDGSSSAGITASSELSAHIGIYRATGKKAIIHGHPKFTVIQSMSCRREGCDLSTCYKTCRIPRFIDGIPVVSGEIGTGPTGLAHTVPEAMAGRNAVIVYGHGIFIAGSDNFSTPFDVMRTVEQKCRKEYFRAMRRLL
ncbi:MAG: class II aldolase/adducin family protein [Nitrospirota bacterium]|nr:class II aldolase/adducin family protein [Nitrospirota bacterium]